MKVLHLIRGASGSGKSTLAYMMFTHYSLYSSCMISADDYFMVNNEYKFDYGKLPEAHKYCLGKTEEAMKNNYQHIMVHNTFTRRWEYEKYINLADKYGYQVQEIICKADFENTHKVSKEIVDMQRERFEY